MVKGRQATIEVFQIFLTREQLQSAFIKFAGARVMLTTNVNRAFTRVSCGILLHVLLANQIIPVIIVKNENVLASMLGGRTPSFLPI